MLARRQFTAEMKADTAKLYAYLRQTDGLCTAHTSATDQGTNWEEFDGSLEPVVEIFQGFHTSYEDAGAPKTVDAKTEQVHGPYKPDGYVAKALAKGYRLGFQSSSDHVSTHVSYACIVAEEFSRKGLMDALRRSLAGAEPPLAKPRASSVPKRTPARRAGTRSRKTG